MRKLLTLLLFSPVLLLACSSSKSEDVTPSPTSNATEQGTTAVVASPSPSVEATPTATPTPSAPTATPTPNGRERNKAAPIGTELRVGEWSVKLNATLPDGTAAVLAENRFNSAPAAGHQFYLANVTVTYLGQEEPKSPWLELSFKAVGQSGFAYATFQDSCGVVPDELDEQRELFRGGTLSGNVCWSIKAEDVSSLKMYVETGFWQTQTAWWDLATGAGELQLPTGNTAVVNGTGSCLNLRASASTAARTITCLPDGTEVQVLSERTYADGRAWVEVTSGASRGWAADEYIRRR